MRKALFLTTFLLFSANVCGETISVNFPYELVDGPKLDVFFARGDREVIERGTNRELREDGSVFSSKSACKLDRPTGKFFFGIKNQNLLTFNFCKDSQGKKIKVHEWIKEIKIGTNAIRNKKYPGFYCVDFYGAGGKKLEGFVLKKKPGHRLKGSEKVRIKWGGPKAKVVALSTSKDPYDPSVFEGGKTMFVLGKDRAKEMDYYIPYKDGYDFYLFIQRGGVKKGKPIRHWWMYKIPNFVRSIFIAVFDSNIANIAPEVQCKDRIDEKIHKFKEYPYGTIKIESP